MHRAGQFIVLRHEKGIQGCDRGQAAVDGAGLETLFCLLAYEGVHFPESDFSQWLVSDDLDEETQVIAIVPPGARVRVAPAQPIDETFDFD
jgi:hypothetical protein